MRKLLVILMLLATTGTALAQQGGHRPRVRIEWGAIAGLNVANYTTNMPIADVGEHLGWQAGIVTAVNFGAFAIEPQILYVRNGLRVNYYGDEKTSVRLRSNSIDVPVLVSLRLLRPVRFYAGPVFTVMNDCKQKSGGNLLDFGRIRPTVAFTAGIGVQLGHTLLDVRYNGQFRAKHDVVLPDGNYIDKMRSHNVAFSVGYLF